MHDNTYFLKVQNAAGYDNFRAESIGLSLLTHANIIHAPSLILVDTFDKYSYLLMDWLELDGPKNFQQIGRQLAQLHRKDSQNFYGLSTNNFIGSSLQDNDPQRNCQESWAQFFCEKRLKPQLDMALRQFDFSISKKLLLAKCYAKLADHQPSASLLHGDLWSGNVGFNAAGSAVIFDPACYYGDRETDIAYTELFGGFPSEFYQAYRQEWPLESAYHSRKVTYNLYHQLNHLNLFGRSYFNQCESAMRSILDR